MFNIGDTLPNMALISNADTEITLSGTSLNTTLSFKDSDTGTISEIFGSSRDMWNLLAAWIITDSPSKPFNLSQLRKELQRQLPHMFLPSEASIYLVRKADEE